MKDLLNYFICLIIVVVFLLLSIHFAFGWEQKHRSNAYWREYRKLYYLNQPPPYSSWSYQQTLRKEIDRVIKERRKDYRDQRRRQKRYRRRDHSFRRSR